MSLVELLPQGLPQLACAAFGQFIYWAEAFDFIGGRTRTRTLDPLIKSQLVRSQEFQNAQSLADKLNFTECHLFSRMLGII